MKEMARHIVEPRLARVGRETMKIIFLNTWHGEQRVELEAFVKEQMADTDIFCFMEADEAGVRSWCRELLFDYEEFNSDKQFGVKNNFYQAMYVRRGLGKASCEVLCDQIGGKSMALCARLEMGDKLLSICSLHGFALHPDPKLDTDDRLVQSRGIIDYYKNSSQPVVIGGDFNLMPDTESIKMFEKVGYRNLIKDFDISTTRNYLAWDRFPGHKQLYADYTLISPDIKVDGFSVPDCEVSDHLPQVLEISI